MEITNSKSKGIVHNPINSLFSVIRTGAFNTAVIPQEVLNLSIFKEFNVFPGGLGDGIQKIMTKGFSIPKIKKHNEIVIDILKLFDPNIVSLKVDRMGHPVAVFSNGKTNKEVRMDAAINVFSKGTLTAITNIDTILRSIFTDSIILFDEMGSSVHHALFKVFYELFRVTNSQIFFNTHSTNVFNAIIRSDQLFYMEKNNDGNIVSTRLSDNESLNDSRYFNSTSVKKALKDSPNLDSAMKIIEEVIKSKGIDDEK